MNKNTILLLTKSVENITENIFETPKEDLLCCFSKYNSCSQKLDDKNITHQDYTCLNHIHPHYLSLKNYTVPAPVYIADSATSSLDIAHKLIQDNIFPAFSSVLCRTQNAGRGQLRRHWSSPEGNIYGALCLPNIPPFSTEAAAPALGGIIANALNNMGYEVFLKWPNDILQKNKDNTWRKVAGILIEERHNTLIAGIGINLRSAPNKNELRSDAFIEAGTLQATLAIDTFTKISNNTNNINNINDIYKPTNKNSYIYNDNPKNLKHINTDSTSKRDENINNFSIINTNYMETWSIWFTLVEQIFLWYKKQVSKTDNTPWQSITQQYLAFMGEEMRVYNPIIKEYSCQRELDSEIARVMATDYIKGRVSGINSNGELLLQTTIGLITILGGTFSQETNE